MKVTLRNKEIMSYYKCTDCKKYFNINKGTYDKEYGFHCIYCGGIAGEGEDKG